MHFVFARDGRDPEIISWCDRQDVPVNRIPALSLLKPVNRSMKSMTYLLCTALLVFHDRAHCDGEEKSIHMRFLFSFFCPRNIYSNKLFCTKTKAKCWKNHGARDKKYGLYSSFSVRFFAANKLSKSSNKSYCIEQGISDYSTID